jgi:3' terminal RNA ribose 2'-O-methyltransferase Hen1
LTRAALSQLAEDAPSELEESTAPEEMAEAKVNLHDQRLSAVLGVLKKHGVQRVIDLGCGEGKLLRAMLRDEHYFAEIVGVDVSVRALDIARQRLERLPDGLRDRVKLLHGSLMYRDQRLAGFDAATVVEVVEHLDPPRLSAFERVLFEFARPRLVVLTTPNREYNALFETLPADAFRHRDHRFEWTREEFQSWARRVAERFGYEVEFLPVGPEDAALGAPTQMGVFSASRKKPVTHPVTAEQGEP